MSQADLVADLKAGLLDSADVFTAAADADFIRHLGAAALALARFRPRTLLGELTLVADQAGYAAPADFHAFKLGLWGSTTARPWDKNWPGRIPAARAVEAAGAMEIHLDPAPTAAQIALLGSAYKFYYYARHSISTTAASTTIRPGDRGLLLLRAQAEAMKEMALRNIKKPVQLRDGLASAPRNGTPAALFQALLDEFERQAA
jgi:hypothetical protein